MELSRRGFLKAAGAGVAVTSLGAMGFGEAEAAVAAHVRPFKLATTVETRNTCPYCSVACGVIIYSKGDLRKGERSDIVHIEGDADHPTNRGTLCPKGSALDRIVRLMKDDRDANFIAKNAAGATVNRWTTVGFLGASATTNETAWATYKVVRSAGIVGFDNQARV